MRKNKYNIVQTGQLALWLMSRFLVVYVLKVEAERVEIKKTTRARIVISNHVSIFDPFMFVGLLSWKEMTYINPIRAIIAKEYYYSAILPLAYLAGCFPTKPLIRSVAKYAGTEAAIRYGKNGSTIGIYPEGKRSPDAHTPAKYGVIKIIDGLDFPDIYLCNIVRTGKNNRNYKVTIVQNNAIGTIKDPQKIMHEVYSLGIQ